MSDTAPILIIGPPRAGTTLLATMLNAHPRLFIANEAKVFVNVLPGPVERRLSEAQADRLIDDLERNELAPHAPLPRGKEVLAGASEVTFPQFLRSLFQLLAQREGKARWGEKTAVAYRQLPAIRAAFPDAKLIALDRDPVQIAASYDKIIPKWGALGGLMDWIDFERTLAAVPGVHRVPYKGLIQDPERTLGEVCAFVGEDFDASMLEYFNTPRAKTLEASPIFAGASQPIDAKKKTEAPALSGVRGRIARRLIEVGHAAAQRPSTPSLWENALRGLLFVKAALWELRQPDFAERVRRRLWHRSRA